MRALAAPPGPPFTIPSAAAAGIAGATQTAVIAAQPLAEGGLVGSSVTGERIRPLRNGDNVLTTLRTGEVVLNTRQQSLLGGSSTFRRIGVPGFQSGGVVGSPINAPQIRLDNRGDLSDLTEEIKGLRSDVVASIDATNSRIDRLRAFVVTEDIVDDVSEGEALRINATLE